MNTERLINSSTTSQAHWIQDMQIPGECYKSLGHIAHAVFLVLKNLAAASCEKNVLKLQRKKCPLEVEDYNHRGRKY